MKTTTCKAALAACLLLAAHGGAAQAQMVELGIGAAMQSPHGDASYRGERLDVRRDLGLGSEWRPHGRLKVHNPLPFLPSIYLMGTAMEFSGNGSRATSFTFGGQTFSANVPFTSKIRLDHADAALFYNMPGLGLASLGMLNVEAGVNLRVLDFKASIYQPAAGLSVSKSYTIPVPMAYLGAQVSPTEMITLDLEGRGIAWSGNHMLDLLARLKVKPLPWQPFYLGAGYRYQNLKIDHSGVRADVDIHGPFLEAGASF